VLFGSFGPEETTHIASVHTAFPDILKTQAPRDIWLLKRNPVAGDVT